MWLCLNSGVVAHVGFICRLVTSLQHAVFCLNLKVLTHVAENVGCTFVSYAADDIPGFIASSVN